MGFLFDQRKSESNKIKHGIDFIEAQILWEDPYLIEIPSKYLDEKRNLVIGKIEEIVWSAIITYRETNIRIISVRRSRTTEKELYEEAKSL